MEVKSADHHKMQQSHHQETEEEEEEDTLSFCDLPIYSNEEASEWESNKDQSLNSSSFWSSSDDHQDDEYFEFFSQELINSVPATPNYPVQENIVFCGKFIPSKDLPISNTPNCSPIKEPTKKTTIFRRNSKSSRKPRLDRPDSEHDSHTSVLSVLASPAKKFRWVNALMFGLMKLPAETGAKNRQQRRRNIPAGSKRLPEEDVRYGKLLWGLIWGLRCGSDQFHH